MAQPLQKIIANRYGGRNLPVTLVLPDGGRVPLSSEPEVEILARTWRGLKALAAPAMGALARAYVHNDIDFTGSARRAIAIAEGMVGEIAHGRDSLTTRWRIWRHQRRSNRANIGYHYDVSNAFYRLWLDPQLVYSLRVFRRRGRDARGRADGQARAHLPQAAPFAGRALSRHRLRLGGARVPGGAAARRRGDRHHAVEEPVRIREAARSPRAGSPAACTSSCATTSICPRTRSTTRSRASGMFEHVGIARFPKYFGKIASDPEAGRLGAEPRDHPQPARRARASAAASAISSTNTCFPGGELAHVAKVIEGMAAQGLEVIDAEALREHYAKTLWQWCERLEANADAARAEVGEEKYRVWRIYLAGSAHAFERGWLSLWQLLAGKPLPDGRLPHPLTRAYMYPGASG